MDLSGISKPMVCQTNGLQPSGLHENDGNHVNYENDEDSSDSHKNKRVECWLNGHHENHGNDENLYTVAYTPNAGQSQPRKGSHRESRGGGGYCSSSCPLEAITL